MSIEMIYEHIWVKRLRFRDQILAARSRATHTIPSTFHDMIGRSLRSRHHSYAHSVQANGQNDRCNTVSMPREPTRSPPTGGVLACHSKRLNSAAVLSPQTSSRPFELWDPGSRLRTDPRREAGPSESHGYTFKLIPAFRDLVGGRLLPRAHKCRAKLRNSDM